MNLQDYGYMPDKIHISEGGIPARVTAVLREQYELVCIHGFCRGRLKSAVYYNNNTEAFPTTGDFVTLQYNPSGDSRIIKTHPRKTFFARRDPDPGRGEQAVAANFDFVWILQSMNRDYNPKRLERTLVLARQSGALPVVLLTKADLVLDCSVYLKNAMKTAQGVPVHAISAATSFGLDNLEGYLGKGKTAVLLGSSGVGKSSLVNALSGHKQLDTNAIRESDGRGRHTTTRRQLIRLETGGLLIDPPGMRELGMCQAQEGISESFADVSRLLGTCKYSDCSHRSEPGCAVKAAIADGSLSQSRWESYLTLTKESNRNSGKNCGRRSDRKDPDKTEAGVHCPSSGTDPLLPGTDHFTCKVCGAEVWDDGAGTLHRNHCPKCLSSLHLDIEPGDRASLCKGIMLPIGVWVRKNGEWAIIHRCKDCGALRANRIAADDNPALLMSIAVQPLAAPPFPLSRLDLISAQEDR